VVIQSRVNPPDWTDEAGGGEEGARCRNFAISRSEDGLVHNDAWFQDAENALPVCNGDYIGSPCPLRRSCLHVSLINNDQNGVFGGMTAPQRRWIRRNIPRDMWRNDAHLRMVVPPPDYFQNYGDEDPVADDEAFRAEQAETQAD
jgi:hypothetical protein